MLGLGVLGIVLELLWRTGVFLLVLPWEWIFRSNTKRRVQLKHPDSSDSLTISVIIPCYNEESRIVAAVQSALREDLVIEVIVSDGGSTDQSLAKVTGLAEDRVRVLHGGSSRAGCQNAAAEEAVGEVLLFLHADSVLPPSFGSAVLEALQGTLKIFSHRAHSIQI